MSTLSPNIGIECQSVEQLRPADLSTKKLRLVRLDSIIDRFVRFFLVQNKNIILKAFRTDISDFHYTIVLKNDNIKNRGKLMDIFDFYETTEISKFHPIIFQFASLDLAASIRVRGEVSL